MRAFNPKEFKVVALRECPLPESMHICEDAATCSRILAAACGLPSVLQPECECFVVLLLNTKRRVKGHQIVSTGILDSTLVHPREVFRAAVIASASAVLLMHNHPSGDPTPSQEDIKMTRELFRAGQVMKIEVLDHVIVGHPSQCSLRELGHCS